MKKKKQNLQEVEAENSIELQERSENDEINCNGAGKNKKTFNEK